MIDITINDLDSLGIMSKDIIHLLAIINKWYNNNNHNYVEYNKPSV